MKKRKFWIEFESAEMFDGFDKGGWGDFKWVSFGPVTLFWRIRDK